MAWAERLPSPMARITVAAPRTMSPPANTPGMLVMPCSSVTMYPHGLTSRSGAGGAMRARRVPIGVPGTHQVDPGEVLVGAEHALEVLARHVHEHRQAGPDRDE